MEVVSEPHCLKLWYVTAEISRNQLNVSAAWHEQSGLLSNITVRVPNQRRCRVQRRRRRIMDRDSDQLWGDQRTGHGEKDRRLNVQRYERHHSVLLSGEKRAGNGQLSRVMSTARLRYDCWPAF